MKKPKDFNAILDRIREAENWRDSVYRDSWEAAYRQYLSLPPTKRPGSNIFVPYTFMQCEVIKSRVAESIFASSPYITMLPRSQDDIGKVKAAQSLLDWQLEQRIGIKKIMSEDVLADAVILGTCITFTGWLRKERNTKGREYVDEPLLDGMGGFFLDERGQPVMSPSLMTVERITTAYDDPVVQKVDLFDFFVDRHGTDIDNARFCGHKEYLTKEQIEHLEESAGWEVSWANLDPDEEIHGGREIRATVGGYDGNAPISDDGSIGGKLGLYKIHHYWEDDRHVVIVNEKECVLDEKNPFWHGMKPYDKCCFYKLSNQFYGLGVPEILRDLQSELNTSRNMHIDYNSLALRRMWKVRNGCGITDEDLIWRTNGVIQLEDMDDLQEIDVSRLPASAFTFESVVKQDMKDVTGCHDIIMGLAESDETATTTMTKDNNASIRFKHFIEAVINDIMIPIARKCLSLDRQFLGEDRIVRLVGDGALAGQLLSVVPEDMNCDYDIIYVGSAVEPAVNKELYQQKMLNAYNVAMANPLVQADPMAMRELLRSLFVSMELKNVDELLPQIPMAQPQQEMPPGMPPGDMNLGGYHG